MLLIVTYALVLPFGAPFLPTLSKQVVQALDVLELSAGQKFVDLGCGDGRLLAEAASRGLNCVGYELNPFLAAYAWLRTRRFGRRVKIKMSSFWRADISSADGVFVFLITHHMARFDRYMSKQAKNHTIRVVSHAFKIPKKKPTAKKGAMYLYVYKAP